MTCHDDGSWAAAVRELGEEVVRAAEFEVVRANANRLSIATFRAMGIPAASILEGLVLDAEPVPVRPALVPTCGARRARRLHMRWLGRVLTIVVLACLPLSFASAASAHPLGNASVNHYQGLTLYPDHVDVLSVEDVAKVPTYQRKDLTTPTGAGRSRTPSGRRTPLRSATTWWRR